MTQAHQVVEFLADVEKRFEQFCVTFNTEQSIEKNAYDCPIGPVRSAIFRGDVFEKASAVYCDLNIDTPPVLAEKMGWTGMKMQGLVLEIGIHPRNPRIPKGYIELRANVGDSVILAGGTDIFPYFYNDDDRIFFANKIRDLCEKHTVDYEELRNIRADFFKSNFRKCDVGYHAGIYSFHLDEKKFPFFMEMADAFFTAYGELVTKRNVEPYSESDRETQLKLHGQWAEWIMVEDEGTRFGLVKGIPPEALLGAILPPVATF